MKRGDVLTVDFPFADASDSKVRPVVVIQSDAVKSLGVVIAGISSTPSDTSVRLEPTGEPVKKPCYVRCEKLFALDRTTVYGTVGRLSVKAMKEINERLKVALGLQ